MEGCFNCAAVHGAERIRFSLVECGLGGDWGKRGLREPEFLLPCVLPIVDEFYNVDAFGDRKGG